MSDNAVIEIFVKTKNGKSKVGATFLDNNVSFVNKIFPEAMMDFISSDGDPVNVAQYDLNTIEERIDLFKSQYICISGTVMARLKAISDYIKNNQDVYQGIKVYI